MHCEALLGLAWRFHLLVLSRCVCDCKTSKASHVDTCGTCRLLSYHYRWLLDDSECKTLFRWRQQLWTFLLSMLSCFSTPIWLLLYHRVAFQDPSGCVCVLSACRYILVMWDLKAAQIYLRFMKPERYISLLTREAMFETGPTWKTC